MKVKELIEKLKKYNPEAKANVVAHNYAYDFSLSYGGGDGGSKENAHEVSFYVDKLCVDETLVGEGGE